MVNEALRLTECGFKVFPIHAGKKFPPHITKWQELASDNPDQIAYWWELHPEANIGILTTGLLVIDVDVLDKVKDDSGKTISSRPNDWQGSEYLAKEFPPTVITPTGGHHYFFKMPPGRGEGHTVSSGMIAPGVDTRAERGYVVAAPSTTIDGQYQWIPGLCPATTELRDAPDWLIGMLFGGGSGTRSAPVPAVPVNSALVKSAKSGADPTQEEFYKVPEVIAPGTSDHEFTALGGYLRRAGMTENEIFNALMAVSHERAGGRQGGRKPEHELRRIAKSVASYEPDMMTEIMILGLPLDSHGEAEKDPFVTNPGTFPGRLLYVPGLIDEIIQYNLSTAYRQQPELALGAALGLMAAMTSGRIMDISGMRPNLYVLGTCPTGGGKEHGRQVNKRILEAAAWTDLLDSEDIASHTGLINHLSVKRCAFWQLDEFGRFLKVISKSDAAAYHAAIPTVMLKMFTASNGSYITPAFADVDAGATIEQPHLNIYATTVPDSVLSSLSQEAISDGLLARFLIFDAPEQFPPSKRQRALPVPPSIVSQVTQWRNYSPGGNLTQTTHSGPYAALPTPRVIPYDASGDAKMDLLIQQVDAEIRLRGPAWELLTRVIEKTIKLSMLYACSRDFQDPFMDDAAVSWASEVVLYSTQKLRWLAGNRIASSPHQANCLEIIEAIRTKHGGQISETKLNKLLRKFNENQKRDIKASLVSGWGVEAVKNAGGGRTGIVWKLPEH